MLATFGNGHAHFSGEFSPEILGGKGFNNCKMAQMGLPVPYGVIIPTTYCVDYMEVPDFDEARLQFVESLYYKHVKPAIEDIRAKFEHPVLFSVRSGARVSMPGMMDTVLNVGITDLNYNELADYLGDDAASDCDKRGVAMYQEVVGKARPEDEDEQLIECIAAVFESWNSERACHYRAMYGIPDSWGTAVVIQMMVFGNANEQSATGVLFTRDPATGTNVVTGEYLVNAQGEDVVAGTATPDPLEEMEAWNGKVYNQLMNIVKGLDEHYRDMMDCEFTVESGTLWMLQCRVGKRSAVAAFRIAHELMTQGVITAEEAAARVTGTQYAALTMSKVDDSQSPAPVAEGIAAGGQAVQGVAVFSSKAAVASKKPAILIAKETTPNDIKGMEAAVGILTQTGGLTSHAAVVARGMDTTCVVGCSNVFDLGINEGDIVTIDGTTGKVWVGNGVMLTQGADTKLADDILKKVIDPARHMLHTRCEINWAYNVVSDRPVTKFSAARHYYIDLMGVEQDPEDDAIFEMVGLDDPIDAAVNTLRGMLDQTQPKSIKVLAPKGMEVQIDKALGGKATVIRSATTLAEVLNGHAVDDAFINDVIGDAETWKKVRRALNINASKLGSQANVITSQVAAFIYFGS